jgi:hypothetical protein
VAACFVLSCCSKQSEMLVSLVWHTEQVPCCPHKLRLGIWSVILAILWPWMYHMLREQLFRWW